MNSSESKRLMDANPDRPVYSIGTVARMLGISVQSLRMYERVGLILPPRSGGNQRLYAESDIERLRCIRTAIKEHKVGIEGIRRMQALVPCWDIVGCSPEDQQCCPAYTSVEGGCWTHDHSNDICSTYDCRSCTVYANAVHCEDIKKSIMTATHFHEPTLKT